MLNDERQAIAARLAEVRTRLKGLEAAAQTLRDAEEQLAAALAALEAADALLERESEGTEPEQSSDPTSGASDDFQASVYVDLPRARTRRRRSRQLMMDVVRSREGHFWEFDELLNEYGDRGHLEGVRYPVETVRSALNRLIGEGTLVKLDSKYTDPAVIDRTLWRRSGPTTLETG